MLIGLVAWNIAHNMPSETQISLTLLWGLEAVTFKANKTSET